MLTLRPMLMFSALALVALAPAGPAVAGEAYSTHCVYSRGLASCVDHWGGSFARILEIAPPLNERDAAAAAERDRLWAARCKPRARIDQYGVRRFSYAASGCEFGRYED